MAFSDFVIYADESGDHSLTKLDPQYPVFVLSLCIFRKRDYIAELVPTVQHFKFRWFGHDTVVLHEREIRQKLPPFEFLNEPSIRGRFMDELSTLIEHAQMHITASVIDKRRLKNDYLFQDNPYHLALRFCLEAAYRILKAARQTDRMTHCIFEARGAKEDKDLELEFRRITAGANSLQQPLNCFDMRLVDKRVNSSGLQIADLTARPIGLRVLRPGQLNRAFDILEPKLRLGRRKPGSALALNVFP